MEKREPLCTVGGNENWCSHYGKEYGGSSKKLKIGLPYDPAIPIMGIYWKQMKSLSEGDICSMFIAVLFKANFNKTLFSFLFTVLALTI